jgi:hypothetical protein
VECWLHHSVTAPPNTAPPYDDDYAAVRILEQIGQDRFGQGISYTWLVTPAGLVFEGHGVDRLGAHTAGRNSRARAICFIGNYETAVPTGPQLRSAAWLLQQGRRLGWLTSPRLTGGHRDVSSTACPGRNAYTAIGSINALAAGPPITDEEDDDVDWTARYTHRRTGYTTEFENWIGETNVAANYAAAAAARIEAKLDALANQLSDDEATLLAAIRADGEQIDVRQLAAALVPLLPPETTPQQVAQAVADEQARRLSN